MTQRIDYAAASNEFFKKYLEFSLSLKDSAINRKTRDLVNIRVSQINGCALCLDMHVKEAKMHGEGELRLHHVAIWRESALFDAKERAAFVWAEALTKLSEHGVPDEIYNQVRQALSEKEISDLTFSVMAINGWNRLSISMQSVPGAADALYGLDKVKFTEAA